MTVRRIGLTYAIGIDFNSLNPDRASAVANAVANAYVDDVLEAKYETTRRAVSWLQDRLKELREQALTADRAVVDFKAKNNIVNVDNNGRLLNEQQIGELNSALVQARAQTAEAQARLQRVQQILSSDDPDPASSAAATVTDTLHNEVITKLRQQYLDLGAKEADWTVRYGRNHLAVVNLRNQRREIRLSILDELRRIAETYKSEFEIAKARENSVQKSLDDIVAQSQTTNEAQVTLHNLDSSAQSYRSLYDNFLQRYMESVQQQSFPVTEARLITQATPPLYKSAPKTPLVLGLALMGGLDPRRGLRRAARDFRHGFPHHRPDPGAVACGMHRPPAAHHRRGEARLARAREEPTWRPGAAHHRAQAGSVLDHGGFAVLALRRIDPKPESRGRSEQGDEAQHHRRDHLLVAE